MVTKPVVWYTLGLQAVLDERWQATVMADGDEWEWDVSGPAGEEWYVGTEATPEEAKAAAVECWRLCCQPDDGKDGAKSE